MVNTTSFFPYHYIEFLMWDDMMEDSPTSTTRNRWLWQFGAFAKYNGIWFPCQVTEWSIAEKPLRVAVVVNSGSDVYTAQVLELLPPTMLVENLEVFYSVFPLGTPVRWYVQDVLSRIDRARMTIDDATNRSLETAIIAAPRRWAKPIKRALNMLRKGEWYIVEGNATDIERIKAIEIPNTTDQLEKLWENYDWARQELYLKMGFAYNPEKRERMIQSELKAQTQLIRANRMMLTNNLIAQAKENEERVMHMVDWLTAQDAMESIDRLDFRVVNAETLEAFNQMKMQNVFDSLRQDGERNFRPTPLGAEYTSSGETMPNEELGGRQ